MKLRTYRLVGHVAVPCDPADAFVDRLLVTRSGGDDPWRVAITDLGKDRCVSTVFLGLDHNFLGKVPHLFESAIFGKGETNIFDRCSTWEEAEAMHERAVAFAKAGHLRVIK